MKNEELLIEWRRLAKQIRIYNAKYDEGSPLIEDDLYDILLARLRYIEEIIGSQPNSPISKIFSTKFGQKVEHTEKVLSLDHGFGEEGLISFLNKTGAVVDPFPIIAEHKIDGVSVVLRYSGGSLVAISRGNGVLGLDVTDQIKFVNVPRVLEDIEVRGELHMSFKNFDEIKDNFSSPRNACAALLQNKVPSRNLKIDFIAHGCVGKEFKTYFELINYVKSLGFQVSPNKVCTNYQECADFFNETKLNRGFLEYSIDGIVLKVSDISKWDILGSHRTAPKSAFAVKFQTVSYKTKITDIIFQVGKFGTITPVAVFDPVEIDGNKITRATIHNVEELNKKRYGVGDEIIINRSGDVVPYIKEKVFDAGNFVSIHNCPCCNTKLVAFEKTLVCPNSYDCFDQKVQKILHFVSRNAFNIAGIGVSAIQEFTSKGWVSNPTDIFLLPYKIRSKSIVFDKGWSAKSIQNLCGSVQKSQEKIKLPNFLYSLCIPNLGYGNAQTIAKVIPSFNDICSNYLSDTPTQIKSIGPSITSSIKNFLSKPQNDWVFALEKIVNII